jgi:hypothetical protein
MTRVPRRHRTFLLTSNRNGPLYEALPTEARDWAGADLEAARTACPNKLDFARLLQRVERYFA